MKKLLSALLATAIAFSLTTAAFAVENSGPIRNSQGMTKVEFSNYCHNLRQVNTRSTTIMTEKESDNLLIEYLSADTARRTEIETQLNSAGYFIYDLEEDNGPTTFAQPSDVSLNGVITSYNDNTGNWSLISGGSWNNLKQIKNDLGFFLFNVGDIKNVGGYDAVGIVLYDTSGSAPALKSSFATINNGNNSRTLYNPAISDTNKGVAFQYQDAITVTKSYGTDYDFTYMGKGFSAVMRFGSDFMTWHGKARGFYAHTWSNTTIDSLGFSASSSSFGLNIGWSERVNHFDIYTNSDTKF